MIIIILYLLTSYLSTCILFYLSPALILLYHVFHCSISLALYLLAPVCLCQRHDFQCMFMIQIYRYTCAYLCSPLGIRITTRRGVLTPLDPHVQVSEFGACGFSQLLIKVAQLKRGSPADCLKPHPSRPPCVSSSFPSVNSWSLLYCSYSYISLYSRNFAYRWCHILVIYVTSGDNFVIVLICWSV